MAGVAGRVLSQALMTGGWIAAGGAAPARLVLDALGTSRSRASLPGCDGCSRRRLRARDDRTAVAPAGGMASQPLVSAHSRPHCTGAASSDSSQPDLPVGRLTTIHAGIALSIERAVRMQYRILNWSPVVWLGTLSYSFYLWQQPFLDRGSNAWWTAFPQNLVLTLACAVGSYREWRDRSWSCASGGSNGRGWGLGKGRLPASVAASRFAKSNEPLRLENDC